MLVRRRSIAALLAAVAVAAGLHAATATPPPLVQVAVATHDLPSGVVLERDDVRLTGFAPGSVPTGAIGDDEISGRTLAAPLRAGEPVTDVRLVGPRLTDGYPGLTAVPVRLPDAGMAALLRVGDRIDLVAAGAEGGDATVLAADVPVLALPDVPDEQGTTGLAGRLVVIGAASSDVTRIADAAVRAFITYTFSD